MLQDSYMQANSLRKRLFSLPEAAIYLGRSTWSVRRLIWSGELPSVRAGGRVHVDVKDMDSFIERNKVREESARPVEESA
jgi:excisionase family DNA binding protein